MIAVHVLVEQRTSLVGPRIACLALYPGLLKYFVFGVANATVNRVG